MMSVKSHEYRRASVSASELAQMGVCERLVVFEHRHGKRRTVEQQLAIQRGRWAHARFYRERCDRDLTRPGHCHAAFMVFGRWLVLCAVRWFQTRKWRDET